MIMYVSIMYQVSVLYRTLGVRTSSKRIQYDYLEVAARGIKDAQDIEIQMKGNGGSNIQRGAGGTTPPCAAKALHYNIHTQNINQPPPIQGGTARNAGSEEAN
jgi:hypothetical protein